MGLMADKDFRKIVRVLKKIAASVSVVEARTERSRESKQIADEFRRAGIAAQDFKMVKEGVGAALKRNDGIPILITGSHFVVGEALAFINKEKYLTINQ